MADIDEYTIIDDFSDEDTSKDDDASQYVQDESRDWEDPNYRFPDEISSSASFGTSSATSGSDEFGGPFMGAVGRGLVNTGEMVASVPSALGGLLGYTADLPWRSAAGEGVPGLGIPGVIGKDIAQKVYENPRGVIGGAARTTLATAPTFMLGPLLGAPAGGALTSLADIAMGDRPPEKLGEDFVENLTTDLASTALIGGTQRVAKSGYRGIKSIGEARKYSKAAKGGQGLAAVLPVDSDVAMAELRDSTKTFVDTKVAYGGTKFDPDSVSFVNPIEGPVTLQHVVNTLDDQLPKVGEAIDDTVRELGSAGKKLNIGGVSYEDLPLKDLEKAIDDMSKVSFAGSDDIAEAMKGTLKKLKDDFSKATTKIEKGLVGDIKRTVVTPNELGIEELKNLLDQAYEAQRALKVYDISVADRAKLNPSQLNTYSVNRAASKKVLDGVTAVLRNEIDEQSLKIINAAKTASEMGTPGFDTVAGFSPSRLSDLKRVYGDLLPAKHALEGRMNDIWRQAATSKVEDVGTVASKITPSIVNPGKVLDRSLGRTWQAAELDYRTVEGLQNLGERQGLWEALQAGEISRPGKGFMGTLFEKPTERSIRSAVIVSQLARTVPDILSTPDENLPPDLAADPNFKNLQQSMEDVTPEQSRQLLSDFIIENPEISKQHFEPAAVKGYNTVRGDDGYDYIMDKNQRLDYVENVIKKNNLLSTDRAKLINEMNKTGKILPSSELNIKRSGESERKADELLPHLIEAESSGRQSAVSSKGAIGLTQLMPETAKALGVNPYDPEENRSGGRKYLIQMLDRFGDPAIALAAYNYGPTRVASLLAKHGSSYDDIVHKLPSETKKYVKKILGSSDKTGTMNTTEGIDGVTRQEPNY